MTDLSAKFASLKIEMLAHHNEEMAKLDQVIQALQNIQPGTIDLSGLTEAVTIVAGRVDALYDLYSSGNSVLIQRVEQTTLQVAQLRDLVNNRMGAGTDEAPDLLTALDTLISNTSCLCDGNQGPGDGEPEGCTTPIRSSGVVVLNGRTYALWNPPPAGLSDASASVPGAPPHSVLLPATGPWNGWSLWVSGPAGLYSESFDDSSRYDTREWRELWPQPYPLCVSTSGESSLTAWLCPPTAPPPERLL